MIDRAAVNSSGEVLYCLGCRKTFTIESSKPLVGDTHKRRADRTAAISRSFKRGASPPALSAASSFSSTQKTESKAAAAKKRALEEHSLPLVFEQYHLSTAYVNANVHSELTLEKRELEELDVAPKQPIGSGSGNNSRKPSVPPSGTSESVVVEAPTQPQGDDDSSKKQESDGGLLVVPTPERERSEETATQKPDDAADAPPAENDSIHTPADMSHNGRFAATVGSNTTGDGNNELREALAELKEAADEELKMNAAREERCKSASQQATATASKANTRTASPVDSDQLPAKTDDKDLTPAEEDTEEDSKKKKKALLENFNDSFSSDSLEVASPPPSRAVSTVPNALPDDDLTVGVPAHKNVVADDKKERRSPEAVKPHSEETADELVVEGVDTVKKPVPKEEENEAEESMQQHQPAGGKKFAEVVLGALAAKKQTAHDAEARARQPPFDTPWKAGFQDTKKVAPSVMAAASMFKKKLNKGKGGNVTLQITMNEEKATELVHHLFQKTSDLAEVDLPMCGKCWKTWLTNKQRENDLLRDDVLMLEELVDRIHIDSLALCVGGPSSSSIQNEEHNSAVQELIEHGAMHACFSEDHRVAAERLHAQKREEEDLRQQLAALVAEEEALDERQNQLDQEEATLVEEEDRVAGELNDLLASEFVTVNEDEMLAQKLTLSEKRLSRYRHLHSLNEVYLIFVDKPIATINGLRLGKLSNVQVPLLEINCACAFALSLLSTLATKHKINLQKYVLCPAGCTSTIDVKRPGKKAEKLDFYINTKFFSWKTFGEGWLAFAQCIKIVCDELGAAAQGFAAADAISTPTSDEKSAAAKEQIGDEATGDKAGVSFQPPFALQGEKFGNASIHYGSVPDDTWTSGVKHALRNLLWCIEMDAKLSRKQAVANGDVEVGSEDSFSLQRGDSRTGDDM